MKIIKWSIKVTILLFLIFFENKIQACSMYKISADGKTMLGYNHDAWKVSAAIWFVNARNRNEFGACFSGSRKIGPNKFAPSSGMNEEGLAFSRLAAYHPNKEGLNIGKKQIANKDDFLTNILHECRNIEEVEKYYELYDQSIFIEEVIFYTDKSGNYLIVEPYQVIKGNNPTYVLANFCPSLTSNQNARKMKRYRDGEDYIQSNSPIASVDYCRTLSDTMSVCRSRNGDGTLLTSIFDTHDGLINLYFYHAYDTTVQFNISEELAKGNHSINIPEIFPINAEYQRLLEYKTPVTEPKLFIYFAGIGFLMMAFALLFFFSYIKKRTKVKFNSLKLIFAGMNLLLFFYLFTLARNIPIYYFDAPYEHYSSKLISLASYSPFLLLFILMPLSYYTYHYVKKNSKSILIKSALVVNSAIYLLLLIAFGYWGLFNILH